MTTDVEHGVKFVNRNLRQRLGVLPQAVVLQELDAEGVSLEHLDRARVQWGMASFGRGDGQLGLVFQHIVGVREFRLHSKLDSVQRRSCSKATHQEPAGGLVGNRRTILVQELVLGSKDDEDSRCHFVY